jgi:hypothetical protein
MIGVRMAINFCASRLIVSDHNANRLHNGISKIQEKIEGGCLVFLTNYTFNKIQETLKPSILASK